MVKSGQKVVVKLRSNGGSTGGGQTVRKLPSSEACQVHRLQSHWFGLHSTEYEAICRLRCNVQLILIALQCAAITSFNNCSMPAISHGHTLHAKRN